METSETTITGFSEGRKVKFQVDEQSAVGEILCSTPSTQTVWFDGQTYDIHRTKLRPYEAAQK